MLNILERRNRPALSSRTLQNIAFVILLQAAISSRLHAQTQVYAGPGHTLAPGLGQVINNSGFDGTSAIGFYANGGTINLSNNSGYANTNGSGTEAILATVNGGTFQLNGGANNNGFVATGSGASISATGVTLSVTSPTNASVGIQAFGDSNGGSNVSLTNTAVTVNGPGSYGLMAGNGSSKEEWTLFELDSPMVCAI